MNECSVSRFRAAVRLLSPDHITPQGRRILEKVLDAEEEGCRHTDTPTCDHAVADQKERNAP